MAEIGGPNPTPRPLHLGAATITIITTGAGRWRMADVYTAPRQGWSDAEQARLEVVTTIPFQCAHVGLGTASLVVDAMDYGLYRTARGISPPSPRRAQPRLDRQLIGMGIAPEAVTHVAITHGHDDHFNVATVPDERTGARHPLFPAAAYLAQQADWEGDAQQRIVAALPLTEQVPSAAEDFMGEVMRRGQLRLVAGAYEVVPGIQLVPSPGETPGHALVRIESVGRVLYCLGDLFHSTLEVEHPDLVPPWADVETTLASRRALIAKALNEDALLVAAHITGMGRLRRKANNGVTWEVVEA